MSDRIIPINEIYTCLQGEGKYMGIPHILLRVTGCRLRCQFADSFCDTPYASWKPEGSKFTLEDVVAIYKNNPQIKNSLTAVASPLAGSGVVSEGLIDTAPVPRTESNT